MASRGELCASAFDSQACSTNKMSFGLKLFRYLITNNIESRSEASVHLMLSRVAYHAACSGNTIRSSQLCKTDSGDQPQFVFPCPCPMPKVDKTRKVEKTQLLPSSFPGQKMEAALLWQGIHVVSEVTGKYCSNG